MLVHLSLWATHLSHNASDKSHLSVSCDPERDNLARSSPNGVLRNEGRNQGQDYRAA